MYLLLNMTFKFDIAHINHMPSSSKMSIPVPIMLSVNNYLQNLHHYIYCIVQAVFSPFLFTFTAECIAHHLVIPSSVTSLSLPGLLIWIFTFFQVPPNIPPIPLIEITTFANRSVSNMFLRTTCSSLADISVDVMTLSRWTWNNTGAIFVFQTYNISLYCVIPFTTLK